MTFKEEYVRALDEFAAAADAVNKANSRKEEAFRQLLLLEKSFIKKETGVDRDFSVRSMPMFTVSIEDWIAFKKRREVK